MTIIYAALAMLSAQSAALDLSPSLPMLCVDDTGTNQPIQRTNCGQFKRRFFEQFKFRARLTATSSTRGTLEFRGGQRGAESISYTVKPTTAGIALLSMRVRLSGAREDLRGSDMCWQTFAILNIQ